MNGARRLLLPCSLAYGAAMHLRNLAYDRVPALARRADIPVVSIGNITVGGTGKTPMVVEVVSRLQAMGCRPAVLTRGYKGTADRPADEVLELREALPGVPVIVGRDRVAAARDARRSYGADCAVLDDGFQHRRLARDLDIVLIDALDPWGRHAVLPAGRLREPLGGLRRADALVVTRANQVAAARDDEIVAQLRRIVLDTPIWRAGVEAAAVVVVAGQSQPAATLNGRRVFVVCGLGNPATFLRLVETLGATVAGRRVFNDHHRYAGPDLERIDADAERAGAEYVVTTRKDWVKLVHLWSGRRRPLVRLDMRVTWPEAATKTELDARLRQAVEDRV